jgi:hypothetical protein
MMLKQSLLHPSNRHGCSNCHGSCVYCHGFGFQRRISFHLIHSHYCRSPIRSCGWRYHSCLIRTDFHDGPSDGVLLDDIIAFYIYSPFVHGLCFHYSFFCVPLSLLVNYFVQYSIIFGIAARVHSRVRSCRKLSNFSGEKSCFLERTTILLETSATHHYLPILYQCHPL